MRRWKRALNPTRAATAAHGHGAHRSADGARSGARVGARLLRDSIPILVDARTVDAGRFTEIVRTIPGVVGVRSVRSRRTASGHLFAEVTILVDGATSVSAAHSFTDDVERAVERELGTAEAIVHVEPA